MAGNNPKLYLIDTDAHKNIYQILSICSQGIVQKQNFESIKGQNSVKSWQKMTGNNPKPDLVNIYVRTNFGQILSNRFQDIEWKRNSDVNQGP